MHALQQAHTYPHLYLRTEPTCRPPPTAASRAGGASVKDSSGSSIARGGPPGAATSTVTSTAGAPLKLTAVAFACNAPVLAVGSAAGSIEVFKVLGLELQHLGGAGSSGASSSSSSGGSASAAEAA